MKNSQAPPGALVLIQRTGGSARPPAPPTPPHPSRLPATRDLRSLVCWQGDDVEHGYERRKDKEKKMRVNRSGKEHSGEQGGTACRAGARSAHDEPGRHQGIATGDEYLIVPDTVAARPRAAG